MKEKSFKIVILLLIFINKVSGQSTLPMNYYMLNPLYFNEAWISVNERPFVSAQFRGQWVGYQPTFDKTGSPPTSQIVSLTLPVSSQISGLGIVFTNDQRGILNSSSIKFSVAKSKEFSFGNLSLGVSPALTIKTISTGFRAVDQNDGLIPSNAGTDLKPNLNASLFFSSVKKYYVGFSLQNILRPSFSFNTLAENRTGLNYILYAGKQFKYLNKFHIVPTVLITASASSISFDVSVLNHFEKDLFVGASVRGGDAIGLLGGYTFKKMDITIGYSFDYILSNQKSKSATSHEFFLKYQLGNFKIFGGKSVKTPRFTY